MSTALILKEQQLEAAKKIDSIVAFVASSPAVAPFERAFVQARAITEISVLLSDEFMKDVMGLMGTKVGFLTDRDKEASKYSVETVKACVMEALLTGLNIVGNHFNIIAGKFYPTKEGFTHLLNKKGIGEEITYKMDKIEGEICNVTANIKAQGKNYIRTSSIRVNKGMGGDAILGKAERKAKKWLYEKLTGVVLSDGDVKDVEHTVIPNDPAPNNKIEDAEIVKSDVQNRADAFLSQATSLEDLEIRLGKALKQVPEKDFDKEIYNNLKEKFNAA